MIKKIFVVLAMMGLMIPSFAFAAYGLEDASQGTGLIKAGQPINAQEEIPDLIGTIVGVVLSLLGVVFFLLILYAGIMWMTAFGVADKAEKSKEILIQASVGLIIVLAAYAISSFVFSRLGAGGESQTAPASPAIAGQPCGDRDNRVWNASGECTTECSFQYPGGACGALSVCQGLQATNPEVQIKVDLCPGDYDNVCCVP